MRRARVSCLLPVIALVALVGCPSSDEGSSGGPCASYFSALTAVTSRCAGTGAPAEEIERLRGRFATFCQNILSAPGGAAAGPRLEACAAAIASAPGCSIDPEECDDLRGDGAAGAACASDLQCASGSCEKPTTAAGATACGTCEARVAVGGSCSSEARCEPGSICVQSNGAGTCVARPTVGAGEVCYDPEASSPSVAECASGTYCASPTSSTSGPTRCAVLAGAGGACQRSSECADDRACVDRVCSDRLAAGSPCVLSDGTCARGLACDATSKTCTQATYVAAGEACDNQTKRCSRGSCRGASVGSEGGQTVIKPGKCVDPIPDGGACGQQDSEARCDQFAECIAGKCTLVNALECK